MPEKKRDFYLMEELEYSENLRKNLYRVMDTQALNCWYGFIYSHNESIKETVRENIIPKLVGYDMMWPKS